MNSNANSTEQLQTLMFLKAFAFTCHLLVFAFGELKLMEGSAKIISLIARDENQHLVMTQNILESLEMVMIQI
jgi:ribonucleotide reductase beta subunit family protein with ferritin-like domain